MTYMDIDTNNEQKLTKVATEEKVGLGVKVVLTVAVIGSIAAGIFLALILSQ